MDQKYYIWSKKHTHGINHVFWGPNHSGYTINLDEAGVYSRSELRHDIPVMTPQNFKKLYREPQNDQSYAIPVEMVEQLGKKMTCILN
jgi:hypothetical protein